MIVINDGGGALQLDESVHLIEFEENYGKNYALFEGIKRANGKFIVTLDDDGQHPVMEIGKLIEQQSHDVVVGQYESENKLQSSLKHWTEVLLFSKKPTVRFTPFKLFSKSVLKLGSFESRVPFISVLLMESTKDIVGVKVNVKKRSYEKSRFSFTRKLNFYRNLLASKNAFFQKVTGVTLKTVKFRNE